MGYHLGVDIGTTFTAAAIRRDGRVEVLGLGNRALQIPSVVFIKPEGGYLVGEAAETRGAAEPDGVVREFKRRLGDPVPILVRGQAHSPQSLIARLLASVVAVATEREGEPPESVMVSHPANWGPFKLDLLRQAFQLADLGNVSTCTEPEAAAITYASRRRVGEGQCIAVYDLGGGTFDAAVLRNEAGRFVLLGTPEGLEHLGGIDFDEAVFQHVRQAVAGRLDTLDFNDPDVVFALGRLRRDCVLAKEALSSDTDTTVAVMFPGVHETVRLTRSELEDMLRPAIEDTVGALRRVLRSAGVEPAQLSAIVLVGGSSRIPLVSEVLSGAFGSPLAMDTHPKHDVALGAALLDPSGRIAPLAAPPPGAATVPVAASPIVGAPADGYAATAPVAAASVAAAPVPPGPPTGAPPVSAAAAGGQPRPKMSRPNWLWGVIAAVVVFGVVIGVVVATRGGSDKPTSNSSTGTNGPTSSGGAPTTGESVGPITDRPVSATPLPGDVIVLPRTIGGKTTLWTISSNGGSEAQVPGTSANAGVPAISPDRRTVAYVGFDDLGNPGVRLIGADGTGDRALLPAADPRCPAVNRPSWRPDGKQLAIVCIVNKVTTMYLATVSGELGKPVVTGVLADPTFAPDGTRIAYWRASNGVEADAHIEVVNTDGSGVAPLTTGETHDNDPAWSPDGATVLFTRTTNGNADIWRVSTASKQVARLTSGAALENNPSWSADSRQIAYGHFESGEWRIWAMNSDGTNQRPLTTGPSTDGPPSWASG